VQGMFELPAHTQMSQTMLRIAYGLLCDLVVEVPGYRHKCAGFDSKRYQSFIKKQWVWNRVHSD
jgi:hypothetical protein